VRRRTRRTIIVLLMGIAILVVLALSLARGGRR
jgi:predicted nucleic acid-binding Zn ribbon protein